MHHLIHSMEVWECQRSGPQWKKPPYPLKPTWLYWMGLKETAAGLMMSVTQVLKSQMQKALVPKNDISALFRSSGSLGFSDAWPQPAHTACKVEYTQTNTDKMTQ